ncbi:cupin domain-containing protein [Paenibacillus oenotherae]|uniref:Cupin domain-containing protein n=1 Tax=Paenibacillus oenotherae TaxID=1435645 RepID=A0ABS7DBG0_9BACL|nr:cupin domain-containing protein [Paenibacillus oenotherae]MBW7477275.1 cupin domain-containing protein [Paenibacillus oenotherae]
MDIYQPYAAMLKDCPVHKISEKDTNKFVILSNGEFYPFMNCIEIFDVNGKTPPNTHLEAFEHFYVIAGSGIATVGDQVIPIETGAHLVVPPNHSHKIENTGAGRLYVFTTMIPDEKFSKLILSGPLTSLDEEDLKVLLHKG